MWEAWKLVKFLYYGYAKNGQYRTGISRSVLVLDFLERKKKRTNSKTGEHTWFDKIEDTIDFCLGKGYLNFYTFRDEDFICLTPNGIDLAKDFRILWISLPFIPNVRFWVDWVGTFGAFQQAIVSVLSAVLAFFFVFITGLFTLEQMGIYLWKLIL